MSVNAVGGGGQGRVRHVQALAVVLAAAMVCGCQSALWLPKAGDRVERASGAERTIYNLGDRQVAFVTKDPKAGRFTEMDVSRGGSTERIMLDEVPAAERRHLVLCLDGVPYDLVRDMYDRGLLPTFYPPTPMISVFPASSDMSFHRILGGDPPLGCESRYYDEEKERIEGGNLAYLEGTNEPWSKLLDYRLSHFHSAMQFTAPKRYFRYEVKTLVKEFLESKKQVFVAYFASCSGLGTRYGRTGYAMALLELDRAVRQLMVETNGRVTVTMLADHGQTLIPPARLHLEEYLKEQGFHVVDSLKGDKDVVAITFGVLTYAAISTKSPGEVAESVVQLPQVDLATYLDGDAVVVIGRRGKARITKRDDRYRYEAVEGDPLELKDTIDRLSQEGHADADGYVEDRALFEATALATYPDACKRLWQGLHGLTRHPPDVIVSLEDNWCFGGKFFAFLTRVSSTHAGLDYPNSVTFVMSTAGQLPGPIRVDDFQEAVRKIGIPMAGRGKVNQ